MKKSKMIPAFLLMGIFLASMVANSGCTREEEGVKTLYAKFHIHGPDGVLRRWVELTPERPVRLFEGEYGDLGCSKYEAKSGGGELRVVNGRLKARNLKISQ